MTRKYNELVDYLGCKIVLSEDRKKAWIGQPETVKKSENLFGEDAKHLKNILSVEQLEKEFYDQKKMKNY